MFLDLFLKVLGGGVTGYITNNLAVKMLFKKYGPFGGVILKTKDEFIENISSLVERDIINHHTLEDELSKIEFKEVIQKIIDEILHVQIFKYTGKQKWGTIPGINDTFINLTNFYKINSHKFIDSLFNYLADNTEIKDIISEEQLRYLIRSIMDNFLEILRETDILKEIINENQGVINLFSDRLKNLLSDFHLELKDNYQIEVDRLLNNLYQELDLTSILKDAVSKLNEKSLEDLIGREIIINVSNQYLNKAKNFFNSSEGSKLIRKICVDLFTELKGINYSLLDLLDKNTSERIESFLRIQLPGLIEIITKWLRENKEDVESLIEKSVEDILDNSSGLKNWIKKMIYNNIGNISRQYKLIDKILSSLEDKSDIDHLSQEISGIIIDNLKNNRIGNILSSLEQNGILKIEKIAVKSNEILLNHLSEVKANEFTGIFRKQFGDLIDFEDSNFLNKNIKETIIEFIKDGFIYTENMTSIIQNELNRLDELINQNKTELILKIEEEKEGLFDKIIDLIKKKTDNNRLSSIINKNIRLLLVQTVRKSTLTCLNKEIALIKKKEISALFNRLNNIKEISPKSTDLLLELINKNLGDLLEGKIKKAVAGNLHKLPEDEVQETLESFMGTELKPIASFGAALGALAGIGLYLSQGFIDTSFLTSIFTYGFVGYITNVIALWMIFHPYQEKKFLGFRIPQTPGVVARNKPRFARSMGEFINNELLNPGTANMIFREKRNDIGFDFKKSLSQNNFQIIGSILSQNSDYIIEKTFNLGLIYINENSFTIVRRFTEQLKKYQLKKYELDNIKKILKKEIKDFNQDFDGFIEYYLKSERSLEDILPDFLKKEIVSHIINNTLNFTVKSLNNTEKIRKFIKNFDPGFEKLMEKNLDELLNPSQKEYIIEKIEYYLSEKLTSKLSELIIKNERYHEKELGELFDGLLIETLKNNSRLFIDKIFELLRREREGFKNGILKSIDKELSPLEQAGFAMIDGEITVKKIIDDILDNKIPDFLDFKRDELGRLLDDFLENIKTKKIVELGIKLDREKVKSILANIFEIDQFSIYLDKFINRILKLNFRTIFNILRINNYEIFEEEIIHFSFNLSHNLATAKGKITRALSSLLEEIFEKLILSVPLNELSTGINKSVLKEHFRKITYSQSFNNALDLFADRLQGKNLDQILKINYLNRDINTILNKIVNSKDINKKFYPAFSKLSREFLLSFNDITAKSSKDYFLNLILDSTLDSIENNFLDLINTIDINKLSRREIEKMNPDEIERLFYSFAGSYFTRLKLYGWLGSGIGGLTEILNLLKDIV